MDTDSLRIMISALAYQLVLKNKAKVSITVTSDTGDTIELEWGLKNEEDLPKLINMMTGKP